MGKLFHSNRRFAGGGPDALPGIWLLGMAWLLQTFYILAHLTMYGGGASLFYTVSGAVLLLTWLLAAVTVLLRRLLPWQGWAYVLLLCSLAALILHADAQRSAVRLPDWQIPGWLLALHIALAVGSYAAFTQGAFWSSLYLAQRRRLKEKQWSASLMRLPSLERLERYSFRATAAGVSLLLSALGLGLVLLLGESGGRYLTDWKVLASFLTLAIYGGYLICSLLRHVSSHRLAVWNVAAYLFLLVQFLGLSSLSAFHYWIWM